MISNPQASHLKLKLLSEGLQFSGKFLSKFAMADDLMPKRRAYNTSDARSLPRSTRIPQEIFVGDVVIAVNFRDQSPWKLDFVDGSYWLLDEDKPVTEVLIRPLPRFLTLSTPRGVPCGRLANLYGGSSLAFFTPASCYYFGANTECRFCSLAPTREEESEFAGVVSPEDAADVLEIALESDQAALKQIMVVGGNLRDYDVGFLRHVAIVRALNARQRTLTGNVQLLSHVATMPPRDLSLLRELRDLSCHITMNLEVFDAQRFEEVAPGKAMDYGRIKMWDALECAARLAPKHMVHTILLAGLEPPERTIAGIRTLPEIGITPIINVFHNDRGTHYEHFPRPSYEQLLEIAFALEETYKKHQLVPYWKGCGRNALDFEAQHGWFSG